MIVLVDTNFLVKLLDDNEIYRVYSQYFERKNVTLALPTPVLAEFLVKDDNYKRTDFLNKTNPFMQILDFDQKSAHLSAEIFRDLLDKDFFNNVNREIRQVIKVDIQIIGMAVANGINQIYTSDQEIKAITEFLTDLPVNTINLEEDELADLPLLKGLSK